MKFLIKIFALFFFALHLTAYAKNLDDPADVAKTFFSEMAQGDPHKAVALLDLSELNAMLAEISGQDGPEISRDQAEEKLSQMIGEMQTEIKNAGGIESIKTGDVRYNSDKTEATVAVTVSLNAEIDGKKSDTETLKLKKIDGQWKVQLPE